MSESFSRWLIAALLLGPAAALASAQVTITIFPNAGLLFPGETQQFTAVVTGTANTAVTWSIMPGPPGTNLGTISSTGFYTTPSTASQTLSVNVCGTSQADSSKSECAEIGVEPTPFVVVSPLSATLTAGQSQQFTATVTPGGQTEIFSTAVTWSVNPAVGSISTNGLYAAPATIAGSQTVTVTATSQLDILATGNATVTLNAISPPVPQTITFGPLSGVFLGVAPFALTATASSGLTVSFGSTPASVCTVSGNIVTIVGVGTCSITASQTGNANYAPAQTVTQSFPVSQRSQTIAFGPVSNVIFGAPPFGITATASSGLPVAFGSATPSVCAVSATTITGTISGSIVTIIGTGTCSIAASQAGNANYAAAPNVTENFTVSSNVQSLSLICTPAAGPTQVGILYSASCSAAGGMTPYTFSVTAGALPAGLTLNTGTGAVSGTPTAGGTYSYTITVQDSESPVQTASQSYSGKIATLFTVSPSSLSFTYRLGDSSPPVAQNISVFSNPSGGSFGAAATTSGGSWLSIPALGNTVTPGVFLVSINTSGLSAAGNFTGTVTITPASGASVSVPVSLTVLSAAQPQLAVSPSAQTFALPQGSSPAGGQITVSNTGGGTLQFSAASDQPSWLAVGSGSGSATSTSPGTVGYTVNPAGLAPQLYTGHITVTGAGSSGTSVTTVTLLVSQIPDSIQLSQFGLNFSADAGGAAPPSQVFTVSDIGAESLNWTAQAQTISGGKWLSVTPGGVSVGGQVGSAATVSIDQTGLAAGQYYGSINITAPGAANAPQIVSVLLTVQPSGTKGAGIVFSTGGLTLTGTAGSGTFSGTVSLFNPSNISGSYSTTSVAQGGGWLSVSPSGGTLNPGTNRITIQASLAGLTSSVYDGAVTVAFDDGTTGTIQVVVLALPSSGVGTASVRSAERPDFQALRPAAASTQTCAGNKPSYLVPNFKQPLSSSSYEQVAVQQQIQVQVVDDCGNPVTQGKGGGVQVTFSSTDKPVNLNDIGSGIWEGTWTPVTAGTAVTLTVAAYESGSGFGFLLSSLPTITVAVQPASATGAAQPTGVANAASASAATPEIVVSGGYVAVYGSGLASGTTSASTIPLPTNLSDTQLLLGGKALPLSYAVAGQVNGLIPQNLSVNASFPLVVQRGSTQSVPYTVTVAELQPGIYTTNQLGTGQGVIEIAGTTLLAEPTSSIGRPVVSGSEYLSIYCTGLGPVIGTKGEPPPADGAAAVLPAVYQTVAKVTATIGGVNAPVTFAGLTPTLVALYQVNVQVPAETPKGNPVDVVLTVTSPDGTKAQSNTVTIAVQ